MKSRYYVDAIAIWVLLMLALSLSWEDSSVTGFLVSRGDMDKYPGYGAPYDVFPPGGQIIDASYEGGRVKATSSAEWTWKKGYFTKNREGWSESNSLTFSGAGTGNWIRGTATAQAASAMAAGDTGYVIAFTCRKVEREFWKDCNDDSQCGGDKCANNKCSNPWRCGCRTQEDCGHWQIQSFDAALPEPPAVCGNGAKEGSEQCDDGNFDNTDACTNGCRNAICGDGFVRTGAEQCDDGNTRSGDGCSATCTREIESPPTAPTISSLTPNSGTAGTTVEITGTGFINPTTVRFGTSDISSTRISDTRLQFNAPQAAAGSYDVSVRNANGESSKMSFTVTPAPGTFTVTCSASPNPSSVYNPVTFTATPSGGAAPYAYTWSGERILGSEQKMNVTYDSGVCTSYPCTKTANIEVKDSSSPQKTATGSCTVTLKEKCTSDAECTTTRFCNNDGRCLAKAGVCETPQSCAGGNSCSVLCGVAITANPTGGCQRDPDCTQDKYCSQWCFVQQDDQQFCSLCGVAGEKNPLAGCSKPTICSGTGGVSVTCAGSPASTTTGTEVTFTATPSGASSYTYSWSGGTGTEAIAGTERQAKKTFATAGTKTANIRVADSLNTARTASASCSVNVQAGPTAACGNWGQACCPITSNNNRKCRSLIAACRDGTCQAGQYTCTTSCGAGTYCAGDRCVQCLQDSHCGSGKVCDNYYQCIPDPRTVQDCYTRHPETGRYGCGATGWFCHYADHKCYPLVCIPAGPGEANPCPTGWGCINNECQPTSG